MSQQFVEIGSTSDVFFWGMKRFEGKLYAGTYLEPTPKAYNYPPWTHLKTFAAGESLVEFEAFEGNLYVATEKKGYIYRMNTPTDWVVVHDDAWIYCKPLRMFGSYLYCGVLPSTWDKTKIIRTANGTSWSQVVEFAAKIGQGLVVYKNELYILCHNQSNDKAWASKTSNGTSWSTVGALSDDHTGLWESFVVFGTNLFLGLFIESGNNGKIYKYDGSILTEVFSTSQGGPHIGGIFNGEIYWLFGANWKEAGSSYLFRSSTGESGTWKLIKTFTDKSDARGMAALSGQLYLGIDNKVQRMLTPGSCSFI